MTGNPYLATFVKNRGWELLSELWGHTWSMSTEDCSAEQSDWKFVGNPCLSFASWASRLPKWLRGKEPACQCKRWRRCRFHPWVGKIPGGGNGNPLQYSCLGNTMDRGAWRAIVPGVAELDMTTWAARISARRLSGFLLESPVKKEIGFCCLSIILLSSTWVVLRINSSINGLIQYVTFWDYLFSLSINPLQSIKVAACIRSSSTFIAEQHSWCGAAAVSTIHPEKNIWIVSSS